MLAYGGGDLSGGNYHGTHVTGTVLGDAPDGSTYETYTREDGHSIGARLIFQDIDDTADFWGSVYPPSDLQPPMQDSYDAGSRMQTNSCGVSDSGVNFMLSTYSPGSGFMIATF